MTNKRTKDLNCFADPVANSKLKIIPDKINLVEGLEVEA